MSKKFLAILKRKTDKENALYQVEVDKRQNARKPHKHRLSLAPPTWVEQVIHP